MTRKIDFQAILPDERFEQLAPEFGYIAERIPALNTGEAFSVPNFSRPGAMKGDLQQGVLRVRNLPPDIGENVADIVLSPGRSIAERDLKGSSPWKPQLLEQVTAFLQEHGQEGLKQHLKDLGLTSRERKAMEDFALAWSRLPSKEVHAYKDLVERRIFAVLEENKTGRFNYVSVEDMAEKKRASHIHSFANKVMQALTRPFYAKNIWPLRQGSDVTKMVRDIIQASGLVQEKYDEHRCLPEIYRLCVRFGEALQKEVFGENREAKIRSLQKESKGEMLRVLEAAWEDVSEKEQDFGALFDSCFSQHRPPLQQALGNPEISLSVGGVRIDLLEYQVADLVEDAEDEQADSQAQEVPDSVEVG